MWTDQNRANAAIKKKENKQVPLTPNLDKFMSMEKKKEPKKVIGL